MADLKDLGALIREAVALGGGDLCASGHDWQSEGGRPCPNADTDEHCISASQPVFRCARCGEWDYGEPGGPGAAACARPCSTRYCDTVDYMLDETREATHGNR